MQGDVKSMSGVSLKQATYVVNARGLIILNKHKRKVSPSKVFLNLN